MSEQKKLSKIPELTLIPVNQTVIVRCLRQQDWDVIRGKQKGPVKIGSLYIPEGLSEEHDPDDMVVYDQGIIVTINETEKQPFEVKIGDYIVFNHGAVVKRDEKTGEKFKAVKYDQIICVWRPEKSKKESKKNEN